MKYCCLNDIFAYCSGVPEFIPQEEISEEATDSNPDKEEEEAYMHGRSCELDIETCEKYIKASEYPVKE